MMTSNPVSNPLPVRESSMIRRRNKMKARIFNDQIQNLDSSNQWKSDARQQLYSTKLLQALRHVRGGGGGGGGKVVRETADRVLAATAKGRSRWSRAILTNRLKMKFMKKRRQRAKAALSISNRVRKPRLSILKLKSKNLPAVQRKVRFLGRLVPGCRKEELPVILEETIDYISAVQMQIRAMNNLLLASSSGTASGSS